MIEAFYTQTYKRELTLSRRILARFVPPKRVWPWSGDQLTLRYHTPEATVIELRLSRTYSGVMHQKGLPDEITHRTNAIWFFRKPWITHGTSAVSYPSFPAKEVRAAAEHHNSHCGNILEAQLWVAHHSEQCLHAFSLLQAIFDGFGTPIGALPDTGNFRKELSQRRRVIRRQALALGNELRPLILH